VYRFDKQELKKAGVSGFSRARRVRFQDVDAAGIIFYPRLLEYTHDLYVEFLEEHGSPLAEVLEHGDWAAPIRHAEADYFRPLRFGDTLQVSLARAHLEPSEVTLGFTLVLARRSEVACVVQTVHTFVRLPGFERTHVPDHLAQALQALQTLRVSP
jgi:YbgC/YbaW family acyl-CoA thioester hydrolase